MAEEARECAKCGAMLPSGDEGLCEVCGAAFGHRTSVMPIVTPAAVAQLRGMESGVQPSPLAAQASARRAQGPTRRAGPPARVLLVGVAAAVLVLAAVLLALLAT